MNKTLNEILKRIKEHESIVIYGHIRPDGDCYGSQFGLKDILTNSYPDKKVYVSSEVSEYVKFLGTPDKVTDEIAKNSLSIVVDTGVLDRCSDKRCLTGLDIIKIDHHLGDDNYGNINWIETESPACSEMITELLLYSKELKLSISGAKALYTGIVTDTGGFRYRGVTRRTHEIAGYLIEKGADVEYINEELSKTTLNELSLKGYLLSNINRTKHFIYAILKKDIYEKYGVSSEDASALVNQLAGIEGYPVWALVIEYEKEIRVRLRSSGYPINQIAANYKGGGHANAAGATLENFEQIKDLAKEIDEYIDLNKDAN